MLADRVWMGHFDDVKLEPGWMGPGGIRSLDQELYADFAELTAAREGTDAEIAAWVGMVSPRTLGSDVSVRSQRSVL